MDPSQDSYAYVPFITFTIDWLIDWLVDWLKSEFPDFAMCGYVPLLSSSCLVSIAIHSSGMLAVRIAYAVFIH